MNDREKLWSDAETMSLYWRDRGETRTADLIDALAAPPEVDEAKLAGVERAAAEKAWGEGFQACAEWWEIHHWQHTEAFEDNPYRKEQP